MDGINGGALPADIHRLTARAWIGPRPEGIDYPAGWIGNSVAAMLSQTPAGVAFLVALYAIQRFSSPVRWLALAYPLAMSTALVYLGEHYVVDVVAGALVAVAVLALASRWERNRDAGEASMEWSKWVRCDGMVEWVRCDVRRRARHLGAAER